MDQNGHFRIHRGLRRNVTKGKFACILYKVFLSFAKRWKYFALNNSHVIVSQQRSIYNIHLPKLGGIGGQLPRPSFLTRLSISWVPLPPLPSVCIVSFCCCFCWRCASGTIFLPLLLATCSLLLTTSTRFSLYSLMLVEFLLLKLGLVSLLLLLLQLLLLLPVGWDSLNFWDFNDWLAGISWLLREFVGWRDWPDWL